MAYRKIEVDGLTYEYTVGRTHVKVKDVGVATREEVGQLIDILDSETKKLAVKPADVARFIRSRVSA